MYYLITLLVYGAVDAMACLGLSQQFGVAGVTNFGFIIFQAAGAYVAAVLALPPDTAYGGFQLYIGGYNLPFPLPWLGAAAVGGLLALPFTFLVGRRLRGDFAAVGLLVTAVLLNLLATNYRRLFNGDAGVALVPAPLASAHGMFVGTSVAYQYEFAAGAILLAVGAYWFVRRLTESPYGRSLRAMRDNDKVADSLGKNLRSLRTGALVAGGAIAGLSGGILVTFIGVWSPAAWSYAETIVLFTAVIIGGAGNHIGAVLGAVLVPVGFEEITRFISNNDPSLPPNLLPSLQWVAIGLLITIFLWVRPQGLLPERKRVIRLAGPPPDGAAARLTAAPASTAAEVSGAAPVSTASEASGAAPPEPAAQASGAAPSSPLTSQSPQASRTQDHLDISLEVGEQRPRTGREMVTSRGKSGDAVPSAGTAAEVSGAALVGTAAEVSGAALVGTAAEVSGAAPVSTASEASGAAPASTAPMLRVIEVSKDFGGVHAVAGVSLEVRRGTLTGLIGPNGAGKSTLLSLLAGTEKVSGGRIIYQDRDITAVPAYQRARAGLVRTFQLASEFKRLTVLENLLTANPANRGDSFIGAMAGRRYWRADETTAITRARDLIASFGLTANANDYAGDLSGGQRRLVEIMRALMSQPDLLLLDEPMAGVHPELARKIGNALRRLCEEGMTILMVEHELAIMDEFCDPVIVMADGSVLAEGTMTELRERAEVVEAYLVG